jgi:hypothetical protein
LSAGLGNWLRSAPLPGLASLWDASGLVPLAVALIVANQLAAVLKRPQTTTRSACTPHEPDAIFGKDLGWRRGREDPKMG